MCKLQFDDCLSQGQEKASLRSADVDHKRKEFHICWNVHLEDSPVREQ